MRMLMTSLGSWDTIETGRLHRHGVTFPLALLDAVLVAVGYASPDVWEGDEQPTGRGRDYDLLLVSMMDPRHMWRLPPWLREVQCPVLAADRSEMDPFVIVGGQAASAPAPVEHLVDIVYVGEAEAYAAVLVATIDRGRADGWSRVRILDEVATIPGCYVPSRSPAGHVVTKVEAEDIGLTLRQDVSVSLTANPRLEIARGCKSRCGFCVLGWRATYRENTAEAVAAAVQRIAGEGGHQLHLSAGDAEGHSGIGEIRAALASHGVRDHGWTGRLDTIRDCSVSAGKQFAVGVEGLSHRLRRAVGKPRLTDEYIVAEVEAYWRAGGRRLMFHLIGGLPGETDADAHEFAALLRRLQDVAADIASGDTLHIEVGRQPFGPLPHTPMQWFAPGLTTARIGAAVQPHTSGTALRLIDKAGQRYQDALLNTLVMRGGREVQQIVTAGPPRFSSIEAVALAEWMQLVLRAGLDPFRYLDGWDPDAPLPWDHIAMPPSYGRAEQRRAYQRISTVLA